MIATKSIAGMLSGGGRYALDVPVAALAGLSVAFLAFAAPPNLLADLVGSLGLSSIIPGAEPPLGLKARVGLGAAGAVTVFAIAFVLLRWLDRLGAGASTRGSEDASESEAPRLRRRDFHPDAPPRPPIMATWELGEPEPAPERPARRERPPLAERLDPPARPPAMEPDRAPMAESLYVPEPVAIPQPVPVPVPVPEPEPRPAPIERLARPAPATPSPVVPDAEAANRSLPELMARLEQGLARRRHAPPVPVDPVVAPAAPDTADDRLQSAIDSLQRLASRQS